MIDKFAAENFTKIENNIISRVKRQKTKDRLGKTQLISKKG